MEAKLRVIFCRVAEEEGGSEGYGIRAEYGTGHIYYNMLPVTLRIQSSDGQTKVYEKPYDHVERKEDKFICSSRILTKAGSEFFFSDVLAIDCIKSEIQLSRSVHVKKCNVKDEGFSTEFGLHFFHEKGKSFSEDCEVFIPGIWYRQNKGVVKGAIGSSMFEKDYYIRITRMALPYIQLCSQETGGYITLCHDGDMPEPSMPEKDCTYIVDEHLQYASLGISVGEDPMVKYIYPGSEGSVNYVNRAVPWVKRRHPVKCDIRHAYKLRVFLGESANAYERMAEAWRHWYALYQPEVHSCDLDKVYEDGVQLIDTYCQEYNSVMGLPFWVQVPSGNVCDISYQMGFVGQQTQCAYHLIRYGMENTCPKMVEKGKKLIDFWVENSTEESFFPQVWYDVFPPKFREDYPTYLRTAADGMEGILNAYLYLKKQGIDCMKWMDFCEMFAMRLGSVQLADGSLARAYGKEGDVAHSGKYNTSNVIRFLVELYFATGKEEYRNIAEKAGEFCYRYIYKEMAYIGGTADNDNTIDKEAGMQALYAFMAMYDLTEDWKWIEAAKGAADFCETWTYSWKFPVYPYKGNAVFQKVDQTGLSLIATGHSHCDVMMGYCPYEYYRLYKLTGDEHYYEFARMVLYNTKQTTDWSGIHGHAYPGLVEESGELAMQYHNGLGKWLPWCTIAEIETLVRLKEAYGTYDMREQAEAASWGVNRNKD